MVIEQNQTLKGQRIIILGGTSGIGLATAQLAASEGASIVVASSQQSSVDRALTQLPAGAEGYTLDLTNEEAVKNFFTRIGAFDHLIFTAGESLLVGDLSAIDLEQARRFYNLRFWGAFTAAKYGSSHIRPGGSIVLTSGAAGLRPAKGLVAVAPITSAVESLGRALAVELAPIRVNVICPGVIRTELWNSLPEEAREGFFQSTGQGLLVGRVGEASDVAQSYLYAIRQTYSTGQTIVVDGGATLV
jgi:NAD(P)-dependent dehydrogenase (short-subunit alcohol dehydrogenase family)